MLVDTCSIKKHKYFVTPICAITRWARLITTMFPLTQKAQELSDIELAVLLSLASNEHCIIQSEPESLGDLRDELQLVCRTSSLSICGAVLNNI